MSHFAATTLRCALHHFETAWLFTRSDFKTTIFPVMIFATVVSPRHSPLGLSCALCWLWFHLFQFNASNQSYSADEDVLNKPWRPVAAVYTVFMVMHDDVHLGHHPIFKNLCNAGGYMTSELGSLLILSREFSLDGTSIKALFCSGLVILLTIHAQDFADVDGDRMSGRRTLPIITPKGSRIYMLCVLPLFSFALASFWSLGPLSTVLFVFMGSWVGIRYFIFRDEICDQSTYRLYNIWLIGVHLLPANVRFCALAW
ncbi:hypothetical protein DFJ58DRAFT_801613 [Suillus subalutaceus]|uniref:uncharacterized protein n=1 Tax=Suillus subalutaceus TaxID=48586 RepID=UPI001B86AD6C|nr:uncharacterized protein DFJ58DRAFT_801613 [Suillus subalutaceus]KAG1844924.1 hypothetical protein DFJ58DRAFT_801613 [Suillus subalutaceus]